MPEASRAKDEIRRIDQTFKNLESDLQLLYALAVEVTLEGQTILLQAQKEYGETVKRIAGGDNQSINDLSSLNHSVSLHRVDLLARAALEGAGALRTRVSSPIWFGETSPFLDAIAKVQDAVGRIKETEDGLTEKAESLRRELYRLRDLRDRLQQSGQRAQYRVPVQILIWGAPVIVGVALSDKLSNNWVLWLSFGLLSIALLSHFMLREALRRRLKKMADTLSTGTIKKWGAIILPMFFTIVVMAGMAFIISWPENKVKNAFEIEIGQTPPNVKPGAYFVIPFTLCFTGNTLAFDVGVLLDAAAFEVSEPEKSFRALGGTPVAENYQVHVPANLPPGKYMMQLICSFKSGKKVLFQKETLESFIKKTTVSVFVTN